MAEFRHLTEHYSVSPQISALDVAAAAAHGFDLIINNRPDFEAPGQPSGGEIAGAAQAAGLRYAHIPVAGRPSPEQVEAHRMAIASASGKVLAYCRSGTRSTLIWAMGASDPREHLIIVARRAGYDLSGVLP